MATVNFEAYKQQEKERSNKSSSQKEFKKVGYLNTLRDDGDEVIVRFAYDSPSQFDTVTVHREQVGSRYTYVSCLRDAYAPLTDCPLCARGDAVTTRFFVKVLVYELDENGNVVASGKVWDRPISFAYKLADFCKEYPDLSDYIFKIKRRGDKGSLKTEYDIIPTNPNIYKQEIYVKDFSCFDNFDLSHHSYYDKSFDEVENFVSTGNFDSKEEPKSQYQQPAVQPQVVREAPKERPQIDPTDRPRRTY